MLSTHSDPPSGWASWFLQDNSDDLYSFRRKSPGTITLITYYLSLFFETGGRPRKLIPIPPFFQQETGHGGAFVSGRAPQGFNPCSALIPPPLSLRLLNLEGEQVQEKKEKKVLYREANHQPARGTWFRGTQFQICQCFPQWTRFLFQIRKR